MRLRFAPLLALWLAPLIAGVAFGQSLPSRLTDKELWQLNADFSESGGSFRSDNFLSNETGFQYVIPDLLTRIQPGGVYLGVGPEQNFTYIVALRPKIAFIFDIRRGNMIEHLMYKALIETSADRADFLSKLFSRPRPAGLDSSATPNQLFDAYSAAVADSLLYRKNLAAIKDYLSKTHGYVLADSDSKALDYIYAAFYGGGPQINYNYPYGGNGFGRGGMPNYATLQTATDSAGKDWAFLATEANYRWLKDFESKNLLIPVVGNFAGPKAIRAVGQYLKDHHANVSAFYTSNVEQYLWQQGDDAPNYYKSVATLPLDSTSTFIRSIGGGFRGGVMSLRPNISSAQARLGGRLPSVTSSMLDLVRAFNEGHLTSYADVISMSR
jgi:hypothetical protein